MKRPLPESPFTNDTGYVYDVKANTNRLRVVNNIKTGSPEDFKILWHSFPANTWQSDRIPWMSDFWFMAYNTFISFSRVTVTYTHLSKFAKLYDSIWKVQAQHIGSKKTRWQVNMREIGMAFHNLSR